MPPRLISFRPTLSFVLLCLLLAVLWIAGGASREDALGQVVVRAAAAAVLVILALFGHRRRAAPARPVWLILGAAILLPVVQLIPLPPELWLSLPGRDTFAQAGQLAGGQPWRPLSLVPGATFNAVASLLIPVAVLALATSVSARERDWLPGVLLGVIAVSMVVGLLQFTGVGLNNPLINDTPGVVSSSFANRNHFALFLAVGCVLAPGWALLHPQDGGWRNGVALGLVLLFVLTILATGSRAGIGLGALALLIGLVLARQAMRRHRGRMPRWFGAAVVSAAIGFVGGAIALSVAAGRAVSIDRLLQINVGDDMRSQALPTVLDMIRTYLPLGTGFGSFDPLFRMHEPDALLQPNYFNHAHNDMLEVVLDGGLAGGALLAAALIWWAMAGVRAWRGRASEGSTPARLGAAIILLVALASCFDYPARTPMFMAVLGLAGVWLAGVAAQPDRLALPKGDGNL